MRVKIGNIQVAARIRKQAARIEDLAADIQKNGLINPITVMTVEGGYQLLAGLRRLRAAQELGWAEIEATVTEPKDAEAALRIEYSENEQREAFTFSEKMDYARLIAEIEKAKARERMSCGGQGKDRGPCLASGQSREVIGPKIGMSGRQYQRARYVADHAPQEVIGELDRGERTIRSTYDELYAANNPKPKTTAHAELKPVKTAGDKPAAEADLLKRAIRAESELDAFKYRQHNEIYHRDSIIENLKMRVAELETALEAANARIQELEGFHAAAL